MEHVGKHLEKEVRDGGKVNQDNDPLLVSWAVKEGIIESTSKGGRYRLVIGGTSSRFDDEDAEGEEE